ncbi:hypothetical protein L2E82_30832 [Cichorium intybus]|uniref:Uncharacterized protein n=1 Tax=Cichorium intybus TaxID=13427 RepID=A0ACB9D1W8_CICIN|nr:hypothetical protein L2E82_30832 [Cichorium intybus]
MDGMEQGAKEVSAHHRHRPLSVGSGAGGLDGIGRMLIGTANQGIKDLAMTLGTEKNDVDDGNTGCYRGSLWSDEGSVVLVCESWWQWRCCCR